MTHRSATSLPQFAQTNIQLFRQMQRAGYPSEEVAAICRAYHLMTRLFSGYFRGSGRPMTEHMVGTASVLAELRAPVDVIAAGILHAVYHHGRFRPAGVPNPESRRRPVRAVIGVDAEIILDRYSRFIWLGSTVEKVRKDFESFDAVSRCVLLIRLADKLEELIDGEILYSRNPQRSVDLFGATHDVEVELAERLGYPQLSHWYREAGQELNGQVVPPELRGSEDFTHLIRADSIWLYRFRTLISNLQYRWYRRLEERNRLA